MIAGTTASTTTPSRQPMNSATMMTMATVARAKWNSSSSAFSRAVSP